MFKRDLVGSGYCTLLCLPIMFILMLSQIQHHFIQPAGLGIHSQINFLLFEVYVTFNFQYVSLEYLEKVNNFKNWVKCKTLHDLITWLKQATWTSKKIQNNNIIDCC